MQSVRTYAGDAAGPRVLFPPWAEANGSAPTDPADNQSFDPGFGGLPIVRDANFGPSSGIMANLAFGEETYLPALDFGATNSVGSDAVFQRCFRSGRALKGYGTPGLPAGWVDNFDIVVTNPHPATWGPLQLVYPGGATESLLPELDAAGHPTGKFIRQGGAPYAVEGRVSPTTVGRWDLIIVTWKEAHWEFHAYSDSECLLSRLEDLKLTWDATRRLQGIQSAAGAPLLNFTYDARGFLAKVEDSRQRRVEYTVGPADGVPANAPPCLTTVSSQLPAAEKETHIDFFFGYVVRNGHPLLGTVTVPSPTGHGKATATIDYDAAGAVIDQIDANSIKHAFSVAPEGVAIEITQGATPPITWIQKVDALGRNTGIIQTMAKPATPAAVSPSPGAGAAVREASLPTTYLPQRETWRVRDYVFTKIAETYIGPFPRGGGAVMSRTPPAVKTEASSASAPAGGTLKQSDDLINRNESMFVEFDDATIDDSGAVSFRADLLRDPARIFMDRSGLYSGSGGSLRTDLYNRADNSSLPLLFAPFLTVVRSQADIGGSNRSLLAAIHPTNPGSEITIYYARDGVAAPVASGPNDPLAKVNSIRNFAQSSTGAIAFIGVNNGARDFTGRDSVFVYKGGRLSELTGEFRHVQSSLVVAPCINDSDIVAFKINVLDMSGQGGPRIYTSAPPYNLLQLVYTQADTMTDRTDLLRVGADGAVYFMTREADQSRIIHRFKDGTTTDIGHIDNPGVRQLSVSVSPRGKVTYFASPGLLPSTQGQMPTDTSLYDGDDLAKHILLQNGDELFGKKVKSVLPVDKVGINAQGQVAIVADLSDGRRVIVRADPILNEHLAATGAPIPRNTAPLTVARVVAAPATPAASAPVAAAATQPRRPYNGSDPTADLRARMERALAAITPKSPETQSVHYKFTAIAVAGGGQIFGGKPYQKGVLPMPLPPRVSYDADSFGASLSREFAPNQTVTPFVSFGAYSLSPSGAVVFSAQLRHATPAGNKFIGFSSTGRDARREIPDSLSGQVAQFVSNPDYANSFSVGPDDRVAFFARQTENGPGILSTDGKSIVSLGAVRSTPSLGIDTIIGRPIVTSDGTVAFHGNYTHGSSGHGAESYFVWKSGKLTDLTKDLIAPAYNLLGELHMNDKGLAAFMIDLGGHLGESELCRIYTYDSATSVTTLMTEFKAIPGQQSADVLQVADDGAVYYVVYGQTSGGKETPARYYVARGHQPERLPLSSETVAVRQATVSPLGKIAFIGQISSAEPDLAGQQITGLFTGPDPLKDVVLRSGDTLFGQTVMRVGEINLPMTFCNEAMNAKGQILVVVQLANGQTMLVRADPVAQAARGVSEQAAPDWVPFFADSLRPPRLPSPGMPVPVAPSRFAAPVGPAWPSDPLLAGSLAASVPVLDGFLFKPPTGYSKLGSNPNLAVWAGDLRADGSRPSVILTTTRLESDDLDAGTLSRHIAKSIADPGQRYTNRKQSAIEKGSIDGLQFLRIYWAGTEAATGRKIHGLIYIGLFNSNLIELSSTDVEPDAKTSLALGEASVLTFRRVMSPVFHKPEDISGAH